MHVPTTHVRWTKPTCLNTVVAHPNMLSQDLLIILSSRQALQANVVPDNMSWLSVNWFFISSKLNSRCNSLTAPAGEERALYELPGEKSTADFCGAELI